MQQSGEATRVISGLDDRTGSNREIRETMALIYLRPASDHNWSALSLLCRSLQQGANPSERVPAYTTRYYRVIELLIVMVLVQGLSAILSG